jgi:hypothetical protein
MKTIIAIIAVITVLPVSALAGQVRMDQKKDGAVRCGLYTKTVKQHTPDAKAKSAQTAVKAS